MAANTILTSIVTGGSNSHATVVEEANAVATDFVTQGVVGAITLNTGSGGTGAFCVNADASPDMGVTVKAGKAYITATPSGQNSQVLRARASTDYTTYVINANASGSTKYDWIYLSVNATNANNPDAAADNVTSIFTSRSTSNTTDTGSPPTYGLLLAVLTVANGASSITNANITDSRFNASVGAQNGSLIVTQSATGQDAVIQAAGIDANVNLSLLGKGAGLVKLPTGSVQGDDLATNAITLGYAQITSIYGPGGAATLTDVPGLSSAVTVPAGSRNLEIVCVLPSFKTDGAAATVLTIAIREGSTVLGQLVLNEPVAGYNVNGSFSAYVPAPSPGSHTYKISVACSAGNFTVGAGNGSAVTTPGPAFILVKAI